MRFWGLDSPEDLQPAFCFFKWPFLLFFFVRFGSARFKMVQCFNTFGNLYSLHIDSYRLIEPGTVGNHSETIHRAQAQGVCQSLEEALHEAAVLGQTMNLWGRYN